MTTKGCRPCWQSISPKRGLRVTSALNGAAGLDLLARQSVDVVVLDLMMPEMDGFDTLKAIRRQGDLPVIHAHSDGR